MPQLRSLTLTALLATGAAAPSDAARAWTRYRLPGTAFSFEIPGGWTTRAGPPVNPMQESKPWTLRENVKGRSIIIPMPRALIHVEFGRPTYALAGNAESRGERLKTGQWRSMRTEELSYPDQAADGSATVNLYHWIYPEGPDILQFSIQSSKKEFPAAAQILARMLRSLKYHLRRWVPYDLAGTRFGFKLPEGWIARVSGPAVHPVQTDRPWTLREFKDEKRIVVPMPSGAITVRLLDPGASLANEAGRAGVELRRGHWNGHPTEELLIVKPDVRRAFVVSVPGAGVLELRLKTGKREARAASAHFDKMRASLVLRDPTD